MIQTDQPLHKKLKKLLVCIGAQKAGTTWLYKMLAADPRLKVPPFVKEVHYFGYIFRDNMLINKWRATFLMLLAKNELFSETLTIYLHYGYEKGLLKTKNKLFYRRLAFLLRPLNDDWYYDYMAIPKQKMCAVDITPEYALIGKLGFKHITTFTKDLKLVFILRDPIERSWSAMIQEIKYKENATEKLQAMAKTEISVLIKRAQAPNIKLRSDYLETLNEIKAAGLLDKLKIIFYDDIASKPHQVLEDIYNHIDIPIMREKNININKIIHKSPSLTMPPEFAETMQTIYAPMLAEINNNFIDLPPTWKAKYHL